MKKALIQDNLIVEVANAEFEVSNSLSWIDCPDECIAREWILVDGVPKAPPEPEATPYDRLRINEYPSMGDQLDDLYKKGAFSDAMATTLKAVKDKHPKPE